MLPRKLLVGLCIAFPLFLGAASSHANEKTAPQKAAAAAPVTAAETIPYRQEPKSFAEQSLSTLFLTLGVLGVTVAGLYMFRNYLQKKTGHTFIKSPAIAIKDRVRLGPKLSMYVVTYRDKEILVAQIGDRITPLSEFPIDSSLQAQHAAHTQDTPEQHAHS